jgi:[acyl-carrier-protein] S-malonyltransferase
MNRTAVCLFPGQGAQYAGMGRDLYEASDAVRKLFSLASDVTGKDLKHLIFHGTEEQLKSTEHTQITMTLVSVSAHTLLCEHNVLTAEGRTPVYAGFSLGELCACYAAGIYDLATLFTLADKRGELMAQAAAEAAASHGKLGMAAVLGKSFDEIAAYIEESGLKDVYPANDNSPGQVVVAGLEQSIEELTRLLKAAGTRRIVPLKVSAPFHTPFLIPAAERFREFIHDIDFLDPIHTVYTNVDGSAVKSGDEAKENLVRQQITPVRWTTVMQNIAANHTPELCCEAGPGTVLAGLWKHSGSQVSCSPAGTAEAVGALAGK